MNSSKKISWHLAAVTAAAGFMTAGTALADGRGHEREHEHQRDHQHGHIREQGHDYRSGYALRDQWHRYHGYYGYRSRSYYPSYYYPSHSSPWPNTAVGARLLIDIP